MQVLFYKKRSMSRSVDGCKRYDVLHGSVLSWRALRPLLNKAVDIRPRALVAMPVLGYISTGFARTRNTASNIHQ